VFKKIIVDWQQLHHCLKIERVFKEIPALHSAAGHNTIRDFEKAMSMLPSGIARWPASSKKKRHPHGSQWCCSVLQPLIASDIVRM